MAHALSTPPMLQARALRRATVRRSLAGLAAAASLVGAAGCAAENSDADAAEASAVADTAVPATEARTTGPPSTEAPSTEPLATEPPATEPRATEPPATEAAVVEPPATEAPSTAVAPAGLTEAEASTMAEEIIAAWGADDVTPLEEMLGPTGVWIGINGVAYNADTVASWLDPILASIGATERTGPPAAVTDGFSFPVVDVDSGGPFFLIITRNADGVLTIEETVNVPTDDNTEEPDQSIEDATELLDGWVAAWNAGDADAVAALFLPDAVLITSDGIERSGERAGTYIARFVPLWPTLARTTDGQPNDDGSVSFNIEWTSPSGTIVPRTLDITASDGSLVLMNERLTPDN